MRFPNYELSEYQARHNPKAKARLGAATLELMSLDQVLALAPSSVVTSASEIPADRAFGVPAP